MTVPSHHVLLSAFEPFDGLDYNPSQDVVDELDRRAGRGELTAQSEHGDVAVTTVLLPVEFGRAAEILKAAIDEHTPDAVISVGLAADREAVSLERVGINLRDARIPDNIGVQPVDEAVIGGAETALFSTLQLKAAQTRIAAAGIPVELSMSAGTFVCNDVLYSVLQYLQTSPSIIPAGFVHIPDLHAHTANLTVDETALALDLLMTETLAASDSPHLSAD